MADVSKITLPSGSSYDIKDATARSTMQPKSLGSSDANKTVITDSSGNISTRKAVDGYTVVSALPTTNIDQNTVYLIATSVDPGGGGGGSITYTLSRSNNTITLTGSDTSTSSVDGGLLEADVRDIVDEIIDDVLGVAY